MGRNRTREYDLSDAPWDPVSGAVTALLGNLSDFVVGTATLPANISKAVSQHRMSNSRLDKPDVSVPTDMSKVVSEHRGSSSQPEEPGVPMSVTRSHSASLKSSSSTSTSIHVKHFGGYVRDAAHVVKKDSENLLKIPRELILGLGKGFHNAPKLYHDRTVRTPDKVTNLKSGLRTAGKEFGLEMYDAVTGVVSQPYHGAKDEGALGFLKGAGKGLGGLLLKPEAGKSYYTTIAPDQLLANLVRVRSHSRRHGLRNGRRIQEPQKPRARET